MSREVVITGVGLVTPAGLTAEATWDGLLAGGRYVRALTGHEFIGCSSPIGGRIEGFAPPPGTEKLDRVCQLAVAAAEAAVEDAGLGSPDPLRTVVCIGTSKGGILSFAGAAAGLQSGRKIDAITLGSIPPDAPARCVAERMDLRGGVHATVAACSTGTLAVIRGMRLIRDGQADVVLCGSSDASLHALWLAAFERMGVLAPADREAGPAWACKPFDRDRAGFVVGEGAGVMVLETAESAARRGNQGLARICGAACATDPSGLTQLEPEGESLAWAIRTACREARCLPGDLACVHAHGTGTLPNDLVEIRALRSTLHAAVVRVPVISIKGAIGHLLGGAGAVELALAALACRRSVSPGNVTLRNPDVALGDLRLPVEQFPVARRPVLKTSLGFGGHVAAVVLGPPS